MALSLRPTDTTPISSELQFVQYTRALKATDGVQDLPGGPGLKVTAAGAAMQVTVAAGAALVGGQVAEDTTGTAVTIAASGAAARVDLIVIRRSLVSNVATYVAIQGTPGSGAPAPVLPSPDTDTWDMPLAEVAVGAGVAVIAAAAVTDRRRYLSRAIHLGERPVAGQGLGPGVFWWNPNGNLEGYDGASWRVFPGDGPRGEVAYVEGPAVTSDFSDLRTAATLNVPVVSGRKYRVEAVCDGTQVTAAADVVVKLTAPDGQDRRLIEGTLAAGEQRAGSTGVRYLATSTGTVTFTVSATSTNGAFRISAGHVTVHAIDLGI